jgi:hypothetical protein
MMRKCRVKWVLNEDGDWVWQCPQFWMSSGKKFKETAEKCYHYRCKSRADRLLPKAVEVKNEEETVCAWHRCDLPVAPNKLRHCSEVCRKRQNRWDYKQRQKAKKLVDTSPK